MPRAATKMTDTWIDLSQYWLSEGNPEDRIMKLEHQSYCFGRADIKQRAVQLVSVQNANLKHEANLGMVPIKYYEDVRVAIFQFNSLSWVYQNMEPLYQLLHSGVTTQEINGKLASPLPILDGVSRATVRLRCDYIIDWVGRSLLFHHDFLSAVSKALNDRSRGHNIPLLDTYRAYIRARLSFAGFDQTALAANGSDNALCRLISVRVACSKPFTEHLALAWQAWLDSDKEQEGNRRVFLGLRTDEKAEDVEMQHIASLARAEYVSNNIGWHIPQVEWLQHSLMERIAEPAEVLSLFVDGKGGPLTTASQSDLDRLIKGTLHDFNGEESSGHASSQYFEGTGSHTNTSDNAVVATQYDQRETFEGPLREECNSLPQTAS